MHLYHTFNRCKNNNNNSVLSQCIYLYGSRNVSFDLRHPEIVLAFIKYVLYTSIFFVIRICIRQDSSSTFRLAHLIMKVDKSNNLVLRRFNKMTKIMQNNRT